MCYAIFSDIHSNIEAFEAVLDACKGEGIDKYLCVGDIVGYAANPKECIDIIRDKNIPTVAGNHDWAVAGKFDLENFNPAAKQSLIWTINSLKDIDKDFLGNLKLYYREENFCLVHGTLFDPQEFYYLHTREDARKNFENMDTQICFVGHTHRPGAFVKEGSDIFYNPENVIDIKPGRQYIINVGSVGQPRDRDSRSCFCIYDTKENIVKLRRKVYNIQAVQTKIVNAGLPLFFAMRLAFGR